MKLQVELLNAIAYFDKETKEPKTRLSYRCLNFKHRQSTEKMKGFSELSVYLDSHDLFNKLSVESFGVQAELIFTEQSNPSNPLKNILKLESVKIGDNVISLL